MVWGDLCRDPRSLGFGAANQPDGSHRREMTQVEATSRQPGNGKVPSHDDLLGLTGLAG